MSFTAHMPRMAARSLALLLPLVVGVTAVGAQQRGTVEFGAFGSAGFFDKDLTLNRGVGGGGHIGVFLDPRLALEFEDGEMRASRTLGLHNVNVGLLSGRLVATPLRSGPWSLQLGAGAGIGTETNFLHSYGVNVLAGFKYALNSSVAVRVDGISDWLANNNWKSFQSVHLGLSFARNPRGVVRTEIKTETRTVEVQVPGPVMAQRPDSVSAEEQARRRRVEADYRALRDSLSRVPPPVSSAAALATMEERIQFSFDKSDLTDASRAILDEKIAVFRSNPSMTILITGHTGNMGSDRYNMALGERRARAAQAYIVSRGIDKSRVQIDSKGESQPVVLPPAVGKAENVPNRRDMFRLIVVPDVIKQ